MKISPLTSNSPVKNINSQNSKEKRGFQIEPWDKQMYFLSALITSSAGVKFAKKGFLGATPLGKTARVAGGAFITLALASVLTLLWKVLKNINTDK